MLIRLITIRRMAETRLQGGQAQTTPLVVFPRPQAVAAAIMITEAALRRHRPQPLLQLLRPGLATQTMSADEIAALIISPLVLTTGRGLHHFRGRLKGTQEADLTVVAGTLERNAALCILPLQELRKR